MDNVCAATATLAVALINASFFESKKKLGGSNRYKYENSTELWLVFVVVIRGNTMTLSCFTEIYYIFLNLGLFACSRGPPNLNNDPPPAATAHTPYFQRHYY